MILDKYFLEGHRKINEKQLSASKCNNLETTNKRGNIRHGRVKTKDNKTDKGHEIWLKIDFTLGYV